jgi:hypothetical protein
VISFVSVNFVNRDLDKVKMQSDAAAEKLMLDAYGALQSDTIKHVVRVQELLDILQKVDGTLVRYEVGKGKTEWEALVPQAIGANIPGLSGATVNPGIEPDGRVRIKGSK